MVQVERKVREGHDDNRVSDIHVCRWQEGLNYGRQESISVLRGANQHTHFHKCIADKR